MLSFEAAVDIAAAPAAVWAVLTDLNQISDWDSGIISVQGTLAVDAKLKVINESDPARTFRLTVTSLDPPKTMVWSGGLPLGLFRGLRTFTLVDVPAGTSFTMREEFSGPMLALIRRSLPDLQPSFDQFAAGLSTEVKRRTQSADDEGA